jgi:hypothetical protein
MSSARLVLAARRRWVIESRGAPSIAWTVFCPHRAESRPLSDCGACLRLTNRNVDEDAPAIACVREGSVKPPAPASAWSTMVGVVCARDATCVRRGVRIELLDTADPEAPVVPVVDDVDRYVGAIVRGRPSRPQLLVPCGDELVEDVMESLPAIGERDTILAAARAMASNHARALPVVNADGVAVGVVDDLSLLSCAPRTPLGLHKRCACGAHYSAERWSRLPLLGSMADGHEQTHEWRTCEQCGSTIAIAPVPRAPQG